MEASWTTVRKLMDDARHHGGALAALFCLALAMRFLVLAVFGAQVSNDSEIYLGQAQRIVDNFPIVLAHLPVKGGPLYDLLLAPIVALAGPNRNLVIVVCQAFIGSLTSVLVALTTIRLTRRFDLGVVAGALCAIHLTFLFWGTYVLTETLLVFLSALMTERVSALPTSRHLLLDALIATVIGLSLALVRVLTVAFVLTIPVFLAIEFRNEHARLRRATFGFALPIVLGLGILLANVVARPSAATRFGTQVGSVVWTGLYMSLQWSEQYRGTYGLDIRLPADIDSDESIQFLRNETLQRITHDPGYELSQIARRIRVFWSPYLPEFSPIHKLVQGLYFSLLYAFAALGLLACRRNRALTSLLVSGIVFTMLPCVLVLVDYDLRYRLPAELLLLPLAAVGLGFGAEHLNVRQFARSVRTATSNQ